MFRRNRPSNIPWHVVLLSLYSPSFRADTPRKLITVICMKQYAWNTLHGIKWKNHIFDSGIYAVVDKYLTIVSLLLPSFRGGRVNWSS